MNDKIKTKEEITVIVKELKNQNKKIVTTNGAFDIFHIGHLHSLNSAKRYGDILIVCLNSDSSIKQYKSTDRPIFNEVDRAVMLSALECVDYVVLFTELDPRSILEVIKPSYHVKSKSGYKGLETETIEKNGGQVILIDDLEGYSSTNALKKIMSQ